jgi:uncharacterized membrane protein
MADRGETRGGDAMPTLHRNIRAMLEHRRTQEEKLGWSYKLADYISSFAGSMLFVWLHLVIYGVWIVANITSLPGIPQFDPSLVKLATAASVEALFLSTFILITQNKMQAQADKRADLNLQISLLAEHEITRLIEMVSELGSRFDIRTANQPELAEFKKDVQAEEVLDRLEEEKEEAGMSDRPRE